MTEESEGTLINELQLLLAEKRTSLAAVRTGIAVLALPLSVMGLLIATSRFYNVVHVLGLLVPLVALCGVLVLIGSNLIIRAIVHFKHYDQRIAEIKHRNGKVAALVE